MNKEGTIESIVNEQRKTYYKLDPEQKKHPGAVIVMPNLPDDNYHFGLWREKGYKTNPQELMPGKKLTKTDKGEYRFEITPDDVKSQILECDICGKECVGEFGLNRHKTSHKKNP